MRVGAAKGDHSKVDELFDSYRDKEEAEEVMGPEGESMHTAPIDSPAAAVQPQCFCVPAPCPAHRRR